MLESRWKVSEVIWCFCRKVGKLIECDQVAEEYINHEDFNEE